MKTRTKIILWILPLLVIVLTYLYGDVTNSGLIVPWKFVGKPSEAISKILGWNSGKLFVETDLGEMYSLPYAYYGSPIPLPAQWVKDNRYQMELDPINTGSHVYIAFTPPPPLFKAKQMYQFVFPQIEGNNLTEFALSEDGNLWFWSYEQGGLQGFFLLFILVIEILAYGLALFIGLVIFLRKEY